MSALQVMRGTAALPSDLEERFRRAYGREMNQEERRFYGLNPVETQHAASLAERRAQRRAAGRHQRSKAA